ncbi:hypothetical protein [Trinickia fusca]|uniref:Uncharacterized protein n=1 Tax=Trinickia fusca TaxID=2419777 RepID=A0A494XFL8_9BURK|nr:hypothetical protein [Trinickia fusca]RKP46894.1 hypothetical protein D7S89_16210 [Trinickia fusca]
MSNPVDSHNDSHDVSTSDSHNISDSHDTTIVNQSTDPAMMEQLTKMTDQVSQMAQGAQNLAQSLGQSLASVVQSVMGSFNFDIFKDQSSSASL